MAADNTTLSVVAICVSILVGVYNTLANILGRAKNSGVDAGRLANTEYRLGTVEAENKDQTKALGNFASFISGQDGLNDAQKDVNKLREDRERDFERRLSRMEGEREREKRS